VEAEVSDGCGAGVAEAGVLIGELVGRVVVVVVAVLLDTEEEEEPRLPASSSVRLI
jgi:hypothetical protein